jgi:hypothetical protein
MEGAFSTAMPLCDKACKEEGREIKMSTSLSLHSYRITHSIPVFIVVRILFYFILVSLHKKAYST